MIKKKEKIAPTIRMGIQKYYNFWKSVPNKEDIGRNEQFLSSFIAHELRELVSIGGFISHETNYSTIEATMRSTRSLERVQEIPQNRYDLVIWSHKHKHKDKDKDKMEAYSVVEVKLGSKKSAILKDAKKLVDMFGFAHTRNKGTIKSGYLAFTSTKYSNSMEERFDIIKNVLNQEFEGTSVKVAGTYDSKKTPNACVLRISRNRSS